MARPREFDIDEALEAAMNLFWAQGYEATSMQELVDVLGIKKGSLYAAFGDKRQLYLAALRHYDKLEIAGGIAILDGRGDGADRIKRLFDNVARVVGNGDRRGCFLCNAAVEQTPVDTEVDDYVSAGMRRIEAAFARALADSPGADMAAAQALTTAYMGLRVMAKGGTAVVELKRTASRLVAALCHPMQI